MHLVKYLIFIFVILTGTACQTVQVKVPIPSKGKMSIVELSDPLNKKKTWKIHVLYPEASEYEQDDLLLTFHHKKNIQSEFPYLIGWEIHENLQVGYRSILYSNDTEGLIEIGLFRNLERLPVYPNPDVSSFSSKKAFESSVRLMRIRKNDDGTVTQSFCNGVRVAKNLVLTNNHCLPDQQACESLSALFSSQNSFEWQTCEKLVVTDQVSDQSLFRLKSPPSNEFSPAVIEEEEYFYPKDSVVALVSRFDIVRFIKKEKSWKTVKGTNRITSTGCRVNRSVAFTSQLRAGDPEQDPEAPFSLRDLTARNRLIANSYVLDCEAQNGQSGSAVYNLHGKLIGVLWGKDQDAENKQASFSSLSPRIRAAINGELPKNSSRASLNAAYRRP